ncbi:MAG: cytochrome c maturation protein CcmE [Candidatus Marinimicrobia bacterium]|nr:cytochrome c maturation protein CcmE [Candidatus Neomarinimicrobiota bacterium]
MSFQKKFAIVIGVFAVLVITWISIEFESGEVPFISVGELIENHDQFTQSRFRMGGNVEEGSISYSEDKLTVDFVLRQGEDLLPVTYISAEIPDLFKDDAEVIVEGKYLDGVFQADNLMTKCASRYDEEANYQPLTEG